MSKEILTQESFDKLKSELKDKVELSTLLQKEKDELQQKFDQIKKENKDLQEAFDAFKKVHEQALADLDQAKAELNSALEANKLLMKTMDELSDAAPSAPAADKKVTDFSSISFEKDGVKYGFNFARITHKKISVSAEEIAVDEKLKDELIALKSGILKVL